MANGGLAIDPPAGIGFAPLLTVCRRDSGVRRTIAKPIIARLSQRFGFPAFAALGLLASASSVALGQMPLAAQAPPATRVFCEQNVSFELANPAKLPERFRRFLGVWSDAAWDEKTCAALIVEDVKSDGTAAIVYVYGPLGDTSTAPGGTLHGSGIIRDGELRFQNSDGTQFAFKPGIVDLDGRLTTPQGRIFTATFKQTP
jgi:hypothetical protein